MFLFSFTCFERMPGNNFDSPGVLTCNVSTGKMFYTRLEAAAQQH